MATSATAEQVRRFGGLRVAAARAGVSYNTVRRWIETGRLQSFQPTPGGKRLVDLAELDRFITASARG